MTGDVLVLVLLLGCFAFEALILYGVVLLRRRPVHPGRAELVRLAIMQRHIDELLTLARANDIAMSDLDNRIADLQEARDAE